MSAGATRHLRRWSIGLAAIWVVAVVMVSIQDASHHTNNLLVFRTSWDNLRAGRGLYTLNSAHQDYFKYSPTFALLFAPFAILPFGVAMLAWNALNAGVLYWSFGRVLSAEQAFVARAIVLMDTIGSMQNAQSNALAAGLMIMAFADLEQRRELRAAVALALATIIKIFPIVGGAFAVFRPYRLPRFALWSVVVALLSIAAPLVVLSPAQLLAQYHSWRLIQESDTLARGYSVMEHLQRVLRADLPNWPVQLVGAVVLLAPLVRYSLWGIPRFRQLFLASVLMFCVLFNHKAESPSFVIALAGIGIWFAVSPRGRASWAVLAIVAVGTILSASDAMPETLQQRFFEPYRIKVLPVLLVWVIAQRELWRMTARPSPSTPAPALAAAQT